MSGQERERVSPQGPELQTVEDRGAPIDLEAWAEDYVAHLLELERVEPRVAVPPAASVG